MTPEQKAVAIVGKPEFQRIVAQAQSIHDSQAPAGRKYIMLTKMADQYSELIAPLVPCRKGCSACCHQAVLITENEAKLLEIRSGRQRVHLERGLEETSAAVDAAAVKYYNVPCPFLVDNECSVYDFRPMPCRVHHSLNETAHECRTDGGVAHDAPIVPTHAFSREMVMAAGMPFIHEQIADVREFFP